jgi:hypothetical protein
MEETSVAENAFLNLNFSEIIFNNYVDFSYTKSMDSMDSDY